MTARFGRRWREFPCDGSWAGIARPCRHLSQVIFTATPADDHRRGDERGTVPCDYARHVGIGCLSLMQTRTRPRDEASG